jgi:chromosome segregation ATPase
VISYQITKNNKNVTFCYFMGRTMKTEQLTYDKFSAMAQKMVENDEKLTVRSVHNRLGGSFGKISEFLKRWEQERSYLSLVKQGDISDNLRQAMLSEVGRAVSEAKAALEAQLQQIAAHLEEANEKLTEQEKEIEDGTEMLRDLKEKQALAHQINKDCEITNHKLTEKLKSATEEKILAITDAAKSKLQLDRTEQDNKENKQRIQELQLRVDSLTTEKFEAEKRAAVAEAKFEQLIASPIIK